jgi:hypothetical protein
MTRMMTRLITLSAVEAPADEFERVGVILLR